MSHNNISKVDYSKINNWYTMAGKELGESYEEGCHKLLDAALEWRTLHPDKNPRFMGLTDVMGICIDDNEDAKNLEEHMLKATDGCSGAMLQQAIFHFFFICKNGLEKYYEELNNRIVNN